MDSMTKMFPVTVTRLSEPVTRAMKNISTALYELAAPEPSSAGGQNVESFVDALHVVLANGSLDLLNEDPGGERQEKKPITSVE